jgi:hypothetical protein
MKIKGFPSLLLAKKQQQQQQKKQNTRIDRSESLGNRHRYRNMTEKTGKC